MNGRMDHVIEVVWAIVPCKKLESVNRRLTAVLSAAERRQLACSMLSDVLGALVSSAELRGILVASEDPKINGIAESFGVRCLPNFVDTGLSPTLTTASQLLADEGARGIVAVHADLPLLTSADIKTVIKSIAQKPAVTLAPAETDLGTNVLAMSPPGIIDYAFGEKSSLRHAAAAAACCIEPTFIETPGLGFDLDTLEDLLKFTLNPSDTRTFRYLEESGIRDRVLGLQPEQLQNEETG